MSSRCKKLFVLFICITCICCFFGFIKASANTNSSERTLVAKSIKIHAHDTLWTIAEKYYSDEYGSITEMVEAIKETNGMTSNYIHTGNYLVVPYYTDLSDTQVVHNDIS